MKYSLSVIGNLESSTSEAPSLGAQVDNCTGKSDTSTTASNVSDYETEDLEETSIEYSAEN